MCAFLGLLALCLYGHSQHFFTNVCLLGWQRMKCPRALWRFRLGDLSVGGMVGARPVLWIVGFLLLRYSVLFTVETLSLL